MLSAKLVVMMQGSSAAMVEVIGWFEILKFCGKTNEQPSHIVIGRRDVRASRGAVYYII